MSTAAAKGAFDIEPARREDLGEVHAMIHELAAYEKLTHLCISTVADLDAALFGPRPAAEVLVARTAGTAAAFALFFHNFSTFLGRPGLWLEDLYVRPEFRRRGCANALLRKLAGIARDRDCGRFEWSVLDWNTSAIEFYRTLGATVLPDWRICRIVDEPLVALATGRANSPAAG
jgi:GNAT superfamily N-acetyltransferase